MWELGMWVHLTSVIYCLWINLAHLCYLRCLFLCFEAVLVLRIHLAKSELVLVGEVSNFDELASILCRIVSSLPMKRLGVSLGVLLRPNLFGRAFLKEWSAT
jgi:hypothetical protein